MNVLFLCTGNSARSILGEVIFNEVFGDYGQGYSAGSKPVGQVNVTALKVLEAYGHTTENLSSKNVDSFSNDNAPQIDVVISVCDSAANDCPVWLGPGTPERLHWPLPDPAAVEDEEEKHKAFEDTYDALKQKLEEWLNSR